MNVKFTSKSDDITIDMNDGSRMQNVYSLVYFCSTMTDKAMVKINIGVKESMGGWLEGREGRQRYISDKMKE